MSGCSLRGARSRRSGAVGQTCQGEAGIGEADLLGVLAENLIGGLDHLALVLSQGLSACFLDAMLDDELVNLGHVGTMADWAAALQLWALGARAISRIFEEIP